MTKVTDRLDNQHIINLARQQYEKQQYTKMPGTIVQLPSKGLAYPESSPLRKGTVEIRFMTAYDEDILMNSSYISNNIVLEKLAESILITPVNVNDIIPTDIQAIVLAAKISSYGKMHTVEIDNREIEIDLTEFEHKPFDLVSDENGEFDYTVESTGDVIKFRLLSNELVKSIDGEKILSSIIELCIQAVNGNRNRTFISDYVKYHLIGISARNFRNYITSNIPGLDLTINTKSENGDAIQAGFRIGSDIFWV